MKLFLRIIIYIIGLFILALGVAFAINSNLGISPVNSVPYAISLAFGFNFGTTVTCVFAFYVLLEILILRKKFQLIQLFQILTSIVFGYMADFTKSLLHGFSFGNGYIFQLISLFISMILIAIGMALYVNTKLIPMPSEGLTLALADSFNKPFPIMKIIVDCIFVIISVSVTLIFTGRVQGVREGTALSAICIGFIIKLITPLIKAMMTKLGLNEETQEANKTDAPTNA